MGFLFRMSTVGETNGPNCWLDRGLDAACKGGKQALGCPSLHSRTATASTYCVLAMGQNTNGGRT